MFGHGTARVKVAVQTHMYFLPLKLPPTSTNDAQTMHKRCTNEW